METRTLLSDLTQILSAESLQTPDPAELPAGWPLPLSVASPTTPEQIAELVRAAERSGAAVIPYGSGSMLQTGYPPPADRPFVLLTTRRMNRLLDYQPDDLTVTCEPGMSLAALDRVLAERRQRLALDVPLAHRATLGGIVSANACGFIRPAYGAPRDLLIGLKAIMTGGVEVKGGGRVVKNVAGYDVCKLFTGAWGTLGVITELTFKVQTRPETERMIAWDAPDLSTAARIALSLHHAQLAATGLFATNELNGSPQMVVGLQGIAQRVDWQTAEYSRLAAEAGLRSEPVALTLEQITVWRDRQARLDPHTPVAARIACLPTEVASLLARLQERHDLSVTAHCTSGILSLAGSSFDALPPQRLQTLLPSAANLVWTRLDPDVAVGDAVERWGHTPATFHLHRSLKQSLDPLNTFSPGRFLSKI